MANKMLVNLRKFSEEIAKVGAFNWGVVGVGQLMNQNINLVSWLAELPVINMIPAVEPITYVVAGVGGLAMLDQTYFKGKIFKAIAMR